MGHPVDGFSEDDVATCSVLFLRCCSTVSENTWKFSNQGVTDIYTEKGANK